MTASAPSATSLQSNPRPWWLSLITGIVIFVIGAILLFAPKADAVRLWVYLVAVLGWYWIFTGIFEIVNMFRDRTAWGWKLFIGLISIIAGGYIVMYPLVAAVALPKVFVLVLGFWGLLEGIVMLVMAFKGAGWAAGILGVLGIIFGSVLIANYSAPGMGLTLVWLAAVAGVVGGVIMIIQAFRTRRA